MAFKVPDVFRLIHGAMGSSIKDGNNGVFIINTLNSFNPFHVIASDGLEWEHVSVTLKGRTATWSEMCLIKDLFWDKNDCVIQIHSPESDYINNHPYCLHLWRPINQEILRPPSILVGIK